jgi:hypothetical protein
MRPCPDTNNLDNIVRRINSTLLLVPILLYQRTRAPCVFRSLLLFFLGQIIQSYLLSKSSCMGCHVSRKVETIRKQIRQELGPPADRGIIERNSSLSLVGYRTQDGYHYSHHGFDLFNLDYYDHDACILPGGVLCQCVQACPSQLPPVCGMLACHIILRFLADPLYLVPSNFYPPLFSSSPSLHF